MKFKRKIYINRKIQKIKRFEDQAKKRQIAQEYDINSKTVRYILNKKEMLIGY